MSMLTPKSDGLLRLSARKFQSTKRGMAITRTALASDLGVTDAGALERFEMDGLEFEHIGESRIGDKTACWHFRSVRFGNALRAAIVNG